MDESAYPQEWLPQQVAFTEKRNVNAYLEVGKLEGEYHWPDSNFPNQTVNHRYFTSILKMKGCNFTYDE